MLEDDIGAKNNNFLGPARRPPASSPAPNKPYNRNLDLPAITNLKLNPSVPVLSRPPYRFYPGVYSHTHFDRVSMKQAFEKYEINEIETVWLDSARVARRTWEDCAWRGYGLANVCEQIGYKFKHHDALEDAKAAGQVILAAIEKTGLDINTWLKRVKQPIDPEKSSCGSAVKRDGNPEGELYGENVTFTGALEIPRREAADLAASIGCSVSSGVTKKTSILVVGDQDLSRLAGKNKSSKHRKAELLISKGQRIRIIKESDFKILVKNAQTVG